MHLWVSPVRDVFGFARRYVVVAGVITFIGLVVLLISDRAGGYYLGSLMTYGDASDLCNFSIVARLIFALLVAMELLTISGLLMLAIYRHVFDRDGRLTSVPIKSTRLPFRRTATAIAVGAMLLFLHLGLYAMAFHADDVCSSGNTGEIVHHYVALAAFAMLYSGGSVILVQLVMLALKRSLLIK